MKKIIILIAILCNIGFCDTIINIYNRVNGTLVTRYNCKDKFLIHFSQDTYYRDIEEMNVKMYTEDIENSRRLVNLIISCGNKTLGYYDYSMFSYSIENIEQSLR